MKTFRVVRAAEVWTITTDGRRWGKFDFKVDAEEAALRLAKAADAVGVRVQILIQGPWGEMAPMNV